MPTLSLQTAVRTANQVFDDHGYKFPWSFVAVPSNEPHELKLRLIRADEGIERAENVTYAQGVHGFYATCSRVLAKLATDLRDEIAQKKGWKITA